MAVKKSIIQELFWSTKKIKAHANARGGARHYKKTHATARHRTRSPRAVARVFVSYFGDTHAAYAGDTHAAYAAYEVHMPHMRRICRVRGAYAAYEVHMPHMPCTRCICRVRGIRGWKKTLSYPEINKKT